MNLSSIFRSLLISAVDLFRPRILLSVLFIPVIVFAGWAFLAWASWGLLFGWTQDWMSSASWIVTLAEWMSREWGLGATSLAFFLTLFWVILVLFPLVLISTIILISLFAMPIILHYLEQKYPALVKKHGFGPFGQIWKTLIWGIVFVILWLLTIPLWFVPPLGPTLSFILTAWFQKKVLSLECVAEYASKDEYSLLMKQNRVELWLLSFVLTMLLTIPIINLIVPIYGSLVFAHYLFGKLSQMRILFDRRGVPG